MGYLDEASVQITLPRMYEPECNMTKPVFIAPFDRFYIKEDAGLEVVHWQLQAAHIMGIDRLSFPIKQVLDIVDSQGKRYDSTDYCITSEGHLKWIDGRGPGIDPKSGLGLVYSIRYVYRPYFYVYRLIHEIRVAQIQDESTSERNVKRMPQCAVLNREYNFMSSGADVTPDSATARSPRGPREGNLGPR